MKVFCFLSLFFSFLISHVAIAMTKDQINSSPKQQQEEVQIIRAEFGLFQNNQFIPSQHVPLVVGQVYGWRIELKTNKAKIKWREQFILPSAPKHWGISQLQGSNTISTDKRVSLTEREVIPEHGVIINTWSVVEGDPSGRYTIRVSVDNQQDRVFVFDVYQLKKQLLN